MANLKQNSLITDFQNTFNKKDLVYIPLVFLIISDIILVLSKLQITIFPLIDRITYPVLFSPTLTGFSMMDNIVITASGYLFIGLSTTKLNQRVTIIAVFVSITSIIIIFEQELISSIHLITISVIIGLLLVFDIKKNSSLHEHLKHLLNSVILVVLTFEIVVLSIWISNLLSPDIEQLQVWHLVKIESEIFYLIGLLSPSILVLIVFSFFVRQIVSPIKKISIKISKSSLDIKNSQFSEFLKDDSRKLLYVALVLSILLAFYYHSPNINLLNQDLSVDIPFYTEWLQRLESSTNFSNFLNTAFVEINDGDRGLSLIIFYALHKMFVPDLSTNIFVSYLPVMLSPFFVFSSYYLARSFGKSKFVSSVVSLFAVFSFQFLVGVYAGFFANWFALSISLFLFSFLIKYLKEPTLIRLLIVAGFSFLVLFTYLYLWIYLIGVLALFSVITFFNYRKQKKKLIPILLIFLLIGSNFAVDFVKITYLESRSGAIKTYEIGTYSISTENFQERWNNLQILFTIFTGGFFTNTVMLGLAFYWCLQASHKKDYERLILCSFYVGILVLLFSDFSIQSRILFDMPIFIASALVFFNKDYRARPRIRIFILVILLTLATYSLRSLSNLFYVSLG